MRNKDKKSCFIPPFIFRLRLRLHLHILQHNLVPAALPLPLPPHASAHPPHQHKQIPLHSLFPRQSAATGSKANENHTASKTTEWNGLSTSPCNATTPFCQCYPLPLALSRHPKYLLPVLSHLQFLPSSHHPAPTSTSQEFRCATRHLPFK